MGCGSSTARVSTPTDRHNTQHHSENGRSDSAPVNGTIAVKQDRDIHSASTVVISKSNTNLNNNNDTTADAAPDGQNSSASKVQVGQVVRTSISSDSVFVRDEAPQTISQMSDTQETTKEDNVASSGYEEVEKKGIEKNVVCEPLPSDKEKEGEARPSSTSSRKEIDECNSVTQLPKVIVRRSINAAVERLSYQKDSEDDDETDEEEVHAQQSQANGFNDKDPELAKDDDKTIQVENNTSEQAVEEVPTSNFLSEVEAVNYKKLPSTPPNSTADETDSHNMHQEIDEHSLTSGLTDNHDTTEEEGVKFKVGDGADSRKNSNEALTSQEARSGMVDHHKIIDLEETDSKLGEALAQNEEQIEKA